MIILFPIMVHGMLKDGVTTWVPTYISEKFSHIAFLFRDDYHPASYF